MVHSPTGDLGHDRENARAQVVVVKLHFDDLGRTPEVSATSGR
jgi:hypothetical protein